jgi:peptide/nickel transport system ATP-binding protein
VSTVDTAWTDADEADRGSRARRRGLAEPVLELKNLSVDYGTGDNAVHAVRNVDLTLHRGEVLGLAGESGSGKSTLAYGMTRLLPPPGVVAGGQVIYHTPDGEPVDVLRLTDGELRRFRWAQTAIVFQGAMNSLNPVHRIRTQLLDVIKAHEPKTSPQERLERARELMALVGIPADRLESYPHQLSGGMRQRVMIGMAMALRPQVVIMDEPTTALDVVMQRQILSRLVKLRERFDFAVLFITHDLSLLAEFSDRIAIMYGGRIVETANSEAIYREPLHPYSQGLLGSFPALRGPRRELAGIPGSPPDLRAMPTGCTFHPRCPHSFEPCPTRRPPLIALESAGQPVADPLTPPPLSTLPLSAASPRSAGQRAVACWLHPAVGPDS